MDVEIITICLPRQLCQMFADIAKYAGDCEDIDAAYVVAFMLEIAAKRGGLVLGSDSLVTYEPYDEATERGGLDREAILRLRDAMSHLI